MMIRIGFLATLALAGCCKTQPPPETIPVSSPIHHVVIVQKTVDEYGCPDGEEMVYLQRHSSFNYAMNVCISTKMLDLLQKEQK